MSQKTMRCTCVCLLLYASTVRISKEINARFPAPQRIVSFMENISSVFLRIAVVTAYCYVDASKKNMLFAFI